MTIRWFAPLAAVGMVLLAGCASGAAHGGGKSAPGTAPPASSNPSAPPADPYDRLILRDGDTVRASSEVVAVPGRPVRFCAPEAVTPEYDPIEYCDNGVNAVGVDLDRLDRRESDHGKVRGYAQLAGVYRSGTLRVTAQSAPRFRGSRSGYHDAPCRAPRGGWPPATPGFGGNLDDRPIERYRRAHPGSILQIALFRPSRREVVMFALAAGPTAPVRQALADDYPHQLCVAHSKYTRAELSTAFGALKRKLESPEGKAAGIYSLGRGVTARGQLDVGLELRQVTPAIAADAAAFAPGLVTLKPWLAPRR